MARHGREAATQALETGLTTAFNRIEVMTRDHHRPGALAAAGGVFGVFLGPRPLREPIGVLLEILAGVIALALDRYPERPGSTNTQQSMRNDGPTTADKRPDRDGDSGADDRKRLRLVYSGSQQTPSNSKLPRVTVEGLQFLETQFLRAGCPIDRADHLIE